MSLSYWYEREKRRKERERTRRRAIITSDDAVAILAVYARRKQSPQPTGDPQCADTVTTTPT